MRHGLNEHRYFFLRGGIYLFIYYLESMSGGGGRGRKFQADSDLSADLHGA